MPPFILAAYRWRESTSMLDNGAEMAFLILGALTGLSILCGLLLLLLAILTAGHSRLDDPPAQLSGERNAREGFGLAMVSYAFLFLAVIALGMQLKTEGVIVLTTAANVCLLWGGLRVLANAGASKKPSNALGGAGMVLMIGAIGCAMLQYVIITSNLVY